jgi:hypothetical protein
MKHMYAIALSVARTRSLPAAPVVPASYGEVLDALRKELGKTDRELARLAGHKGGPKDQTMRRLRVGTGSVKSAIAVRDALVKLGKDVPPVPIPGSAASPRLEHWMQQWVDLGKRLREHASDEQFEKCVADVRGLVEALELVTRHLTAISRPR